MMDHANTFALLIGASEFPEDKSIAAIPNIVANIEQLKACLVDKTLVGIPEGQVIVSLNETKRQVEKKLVDIAEKTRSKNTSLIVYYSGHGILSAKKYQLYLTTKETSMKYLELDSIAVDSFKGYLRDSRSGCKVMILDCCHSGAIFGQMGNMASAIRANIKSEGIYVMTSAAENMPALFPFGETTRPTYFTGKLIDILNNGVPGAPELFTVNNVYQQIEAEFREADLPLPQQSNVNNADKFYLARNKQFDPDALVNGDRVADRSLKKTILRELNIAECMFVSFTISWMLSAIWLTYDDEDGWLGYVGAERTHVFDFIFVGYCLFYLIFAASIRRFNIFVSKLFGAGSFVLLAFLSYLFNGNELVMDMEWDYMDADWSISYKTFFLIPILCVMFYPVKRQQKSDVFRWLFLPFLTTVAIRFIYYEVILSTGSAFTYDHLVRNIVGAIYVIFNFILLGFILKNKIGIMPTWKVCLIALLVLLVPFDNLISWMDYGRWYWIFSWKKIAICSILPALLLSVHHYFGPGKRVRGVIGQKNKYNQ